MSVDSQEGLPGTPPPPHAPGLVPSAALAWPGLGHGGVVAGRRHQAHHGEGRGALRGRFPGAQQPCQAGEGAGRHDGPLVVAWAATYPPK